MYSYRACPHSSGFFTSLWERYRANEYLFELGVLLWEQKSPVPVSSHTYNKPHIFDNITYIFLLHFLLKKVFSRFVCQQKNYCSLFARKKSYTVSKNNTPTLIKNINTQKKSKRNNFEAFGIIIVCPQRKVCARSSTTRRNVEKSAHHQLWAPSTYFFLNPGCCDLDLFSSQVPQPTASRWWMENTSSIPPTSSYTHEKRLLPPQLTPLGHITYIPILVTGCALCCLNTCDNKWF